MNRKLPDSLTASTITKKINALANPHVGITTQVVDFTLREYPLSHLNSIYHNNSLFENPDAIGVVMIVSPNREQPISAQAYLQDGQPPFTLSTIDYIAHDIVPSVFNTEIFNDAQVLKHMSSGAIRSYDAATDETIYLARPPVTPKTLIKTSDGRIYLSTDTVKELLAKIEKALYDVDHDLSSLSDQKKPPEPS